MAKWTLTDADREFVARHVEPFLPNRIFDAHAHLFAHEHFAANGLPDGLADTPPRLGLAEYDQFIGWIHPGYRTVGGLFFGLASSTILTVLVIPVIYVLLRDDGKGLEEGGEPAAREA